MTVRHISAVRCNRRYVSTATESEKSFEFQVAMNKSSQIVRLFYSVVCESLHRLRALVCRPVGSVLGHVLSEFLLSLSFVIVGLLLAAYYLCMMSRRSWKSVFAMTMVHVLRVSRVTLNHLLLIRSTAHDR